MADAKKNEWMGRVLGVAFGADSGGGAALAAWQHARADAVAQLRKLGRAIEAVNDPEASSAIILIEAIVKNLTSKPADRRAVAELNRYLSTDDIITEAERPNGFGMKVALREPLLRALVPLASELPD